jgi:hypothetical protein
LSRECRSELTNEGKRFLIAMSALAVLGLLEWFTLSPEPLRLIRSPHGEPLLAVSVRGVALAVLALFAFRAWMHRQRQMLEEKDRSGRQEHGGASGNGRE